MRLWASLGLVGAAFSAQAFTLTLISVGTYVPGYSTAENVVFQITPASLTALASTGTVINPGPTQSLNGTAVYTGGPDSLTLSYSTTPVVFTGSTASYSGSWNYVTGTGAYAGLTGSGTMTVQFTTTGLATHTVSGDIESAVPEPASMAVLGLGAAALLRRRRK